MPQLLEANLSAWRVFNVCSSQMRVVGMGTPIGLDIDAIDLAIARAGINEFEERDVFFKVQELGLAYARHLRIKEEARQVNEAKKAGKKIPTTRVQKQPPPMFTPEEIRARRAAQDEEIRALMADPDAAVSCAPPGGEDDEFEV